jgi:hypothetical protein
MDELFCGLLISPWFSLLPAGPDGSDDGLEPGIVDVLSEPLPDMPVPVPELPVPGEVSDGVVAPVSAPLFELTPGCELDPLPMPGLEVLPAPVPPAASPETFPVPAPPPAEAANAADVPNKTPAKVMAISFFIG